MLSGPTLPHSYDIGQRHCSQVILCSHNWGHLRTPRIDFLRLVALLSGCISYRFLLVYTTPASAFFWENESKMRMGGQVVQSTRGEHRFTLLSCWGMLEGNWDKMLISGEIHWASQRKTRQIQLTVSDCSKRQWKAACRDVCSPATKKQCQIHGRCES